MDQAKSENPKNESKQHHTKSETQAVSKKPVESTSKGSTLAVLFGVCALAVAGASFYYTRTLQQQSTLAAAHQQERVDATAQLKQQLGETLAHQQETVQQLRAELDHLHSKSQADTEAWVLAEVEYLLQIAQYNLAYEANTVVATNVLKVADRRLLSLSHGGFAEVRAAIAKDIAQLEATPTVDREGLVLRLAALSERLDSLPITDHKLSEEGVTAQSSDALSTSSHWREALHTSLDTLKKAVIIRRLDAPLKPLLAPEQHANLIENIQFQLTMASFAVLHRDAKLYQHAIEQARSWVQAYLKSTESTTALLNALDELAKVEVAPQVPPLQLSASALKKAMSQKGQGSADADFSASTQSEFAPRMLFPDNTPKVVRS